MIKKFSNTILVWSVLSSLLMIIFLVNMGVKTRSPEEYNERKKASVNNKFVVPGQIESIGALEIIIGGEAHRYQRTKAGNWIYHQEYGDSTKNHERTTVDQHSKIQYALTGFGRAQKERVFKYNPLADEYGVSNPKIYLIIYTHASDSLPWRKIAVGDVAPDTVSRYILIGFTIFTIANFHIDNLVKLINETSN